MAPVSAPPTPLYSAPSLFFCPNPLYSGLVTWRARCGALAPASSRCRWGCCCRPSSSVGNCPRVPRASSGQRFGSRGRSLGRSPSPRTPAGVPVEMLTGAFPRRGATCAHLVPRGGSPAVPAGSATSLLTSSQVASPALPAARPFFQSLRCFFPEVACVGGGWRGAAVGWDNPAVRARVALVLCPAGCLLGCSVHSCSLC